MAIVTADSKLLTLTENGYGKVSIVGKWEDVEAPECQRRKRSWSSGAGAAGRA